MENYLPPDILRLVAYFLDPQTFCEFLICDKRYYKSLRECVVYKQSEHFLSLNKIINLSVKYKVIPLIHYWVPIVAHTNPQELTSQLHRLDSQYMRFFLYYLLPYKFAFESHHNDRLKISKMVIFKIVENSDIESYNILEPRILFNSLYDMVFMIAFRRQNLKFIEELVSQKQIDLLPSDFEEKEFWQEINETTLGLSKIIAKKGIKIEVDMTQRIINKNLDSDFILKFLRNVTKTTIPRIIHYVFRAAEWRENYGILKILRDNQLLKINMRSILSPKIIQQLFTQKLVENDILLSNIVYNDLLEGFKFIYPKLQNSLSYFCSNKRGTNILEFILKENIELNQDHIRDLLTNSNVEIIGIILKYRKIKFDNRELELA